MRAGVSDSAPTGRVDPQAIWGAYSDDLVRFATLLVGADDAHDVVSIAFHRVMDRLRDGTNVTHVRRYLMRSVVNVANDQRRSRKRRQRRDVHAVIAETASGAQEGIAGRVDIRNAVADLSVQQRAVVYFTYWEDLDSNAVGQLLGIAPATVRRHLARARFQLRKELS